MLEFIVLGQIPGTGLVITFSWIVAATVVIGIASLLRHEVNQRHNEQQVTIEELAI